MKKVGMIIILILGIIVFANLQQEEKTKGIYISYIEISNHLKDKEELESKQEINQMIHNVKEMGLNTIILQVRPSMDAIYLSDVFPTSKYIKEEGNMSYDVLSYFISKSHKEKIKVIAWINPYRILTQGTREDIPLNSLVYEKRYTDLVVEVNGVFLNPAKEESTRIILEGIDELLMYSIDGILMDDYFYPGENVDEEDYKEYQINHPNSTIQEFHIQIINDMIRKVHSRCKQKKVPFGVSPEGNIENNYMTNAADVKRWLKEDGYIDFIMPQLYYGFENETKPFINTFKEWQELNKRKIPLIPALALYKVGTVDTYARSGQNEWLENDNIIQKEIIHLKNQKDYQGFVIYRYDNIWEEDYFTKTSKKEIDNMKKVIK